MINTTYTQLEDTLDNSSWFQIEPSESTYLEVNLSILQKRFPHLIDPVKQSESVLQECVLNMVKEGLFVCRRSTAAAAFDYYTPKWFQKDLPALLKRIEDLLQHGTELLLIPGFGLGYTMMNLLDLIKKQSRSTSVVFIENRPELILAQFSLFDCREALDYPDFHWAIGADFTEQLDHIFNEEALYTTNRNRIASLPERCIQPDEHTQFKQLNRWFVENQNQFLAKQQQWRDQYDLRVQQPANLQNGIVWTAGLVDAYAHTPLLKSLSSGIAGLGMQQTYFPLNQSRTNGERITQSLLKTCPDMYLFLHLASARVIPAEINRPRIIWYLDHPKHYEWEANGPAFYENDFIFYSDRHYASYFDQTNAGGSDHLTVCPSLQRAGNHREEYAAPVMFVGSHNPVATMTKHLKGSVRDDVFHLVDELTLHPTNSVAETMQNLKISDASQDWFYQTAERFTAAIQRDFPTKNNQLEYFFYALTNSHKRERYIKALLDFGLVIYGPDSWVDFLGTKYAKHFRGWLSHDDLADAYTSAKICINIHSLQCPTCLNSRDFDVLMAGGCLVSDEVEDFYQGYLQPGHDAAVYQTPDELAHTVQELLDDDEKREALRLQGHQTVMEKHQPVHRAQQIMQALQSRRW